MRKYGIVVALLLIASVWEPSIARGNPTDFPLGWYDTRYAIPFHDYSALDEAATAGTSVFLPYLYFETWERTAYLDAAAARGVKVLVTVGDWTTGSSGVPLTDLAAIQTHINEVKDHPAVYGYYLYDEPEVAGISPEIVIAAYQAAKAADPNKPVVVAFMGHLDASIDPYIAGTDVVAVDKYAIHNGDAEFASDLASVAVQAKVDAPKVHAAGKSYWFIPQAFSGDVYRMPTFAEERYMMYAPITLGADGILDWVCGDHEGYGNTAAERSSIVNPIFREIRGMTSLLLKGTVGISANSSIGDQNLANSYGTTYGLHKITYTFRGDSAGAVLVAVNNSADTMSNVDFHLSGLAAGIASGIVMGESRTVALSGGNFTDSFGPYGVHVYMFGGILNVAPDSRSANWPMGQTTFDVSSSGTGSMAWTAEVVSGADWLTISSGATGVNNGTITVDYAQNNDTVNGRVGIIRVSAASGYESPKLLTITQARHVPMPISQWNFEQADGTVVADVYGLNPGGINSQWNWGGTFSWVTPSTGSVKFGQYAFQQTGYYRFYGLGQDGAWPPFVSGFKTEAGGMAVWACIPTTAVDGMTILSTPILAGEDSSNPMRIEMVAGGRVTVKGIPYGGNLGTNSSVVADGQYHHFAVIWDHPITSQGYGSASLYVDGVLVGTQSYHRGYANSYYPVTTAITLAGRSIYTTDGQADGVTFDGSLVLFDKALTASEAHDLFDPPATSPILSVNPASSNVSWKAGEATIAVSNTGVGTMTWTAEVMSGAEWLSIANGASGTNAGTITVSVAANSDVVNGRIGTIRITAAGAVDSPRDVTVVQARHIPAPVSQLDFEQADGTVVADVYGLNPGGINSQWNWGGTFSWVTPSTGSVKFGQYAFQQTGYYRLYGLSKDATWPPFVSGFKTEAGAMAVWACIPSSAVAGQTILSTPILTSADYSNPMRIEMNSDGKATVKGIPYGGDLGVDSSVVADGQYHHLAMVWDHVTGDYGAVSFYVDGVLVGSKSYHRGYANSYYPVTTAITLAGRSIYTTDGQADGVTFDGSLVLFDKALTAGEVQELTAPPAPSFALSVTPANQDAGWTAGTTTFDVANGGSGDMAWSAEVVSGAEWLHLTSGSGTNAGTVSVDVDLNGDTAARTGTIRITAAGATGSPVDVTVVQAKHPGPGDANEDGVVNFSDYLDFSVGFGSTGTPGTMWGQGDFNEDGVVNFSDYLVLSSNFGSGGAVSADEVAKFKAASADLEDASQADAVQQTLPCTPLAMALMAVIGLALYGLGSSFRE